MPRDADVESTPARISVICSVRNDVRHIRAALNSALVPDIAELVVFDDGSTDGTVAVLKDVQRQDSRVRIIESAPVGRGSAIAAAFRASSGDLVLNIDADDVIHAGWVRAGVAVLKANPSFAVVAASPLYLTQDAEISWPKLAQSHFRDVTSRVAFYNPVVHSSALMRRSAVERVGGYDASCRTHVDWDLWIRLAAARWRLGAVDAQLVAKRLHDGQKFERHDRLRYLAASLATQARAIRLTRGGAMAWVFLCARLLWGLLPRAVRMPVRRFLASRSGSERLHSARVQLERSHPSIHEV